ncbi:MAG TPA: NAD(P)H-hydrate dehydratase [Sphingobacteriaceae bacterium]
MLNILTSSQIREADNHTIKSKSIASVDLMEAAAMAFVKIFKEQYPDKNKSISVYCGTGNNGGDGLAIARLLKEDGYQPAVKIARFNPKSSADFDTNREQLTKTPLLVSEISNADDIQEEADIIIDALLGSGLNKPLAGEWQKLVKKINSLETMVVSVDVPSGFASEGFLESETVHADLVISFQRPKINFFLPESADAIKKFRIADIGLDEHFIHSCETPYHLVSEEDIRRLIKMRQPFSHKGTYGHALIIAGARETMGAALLCSEACLNTGAGLTTACIPASGLTALNVRTPEVMAALRHDDDLPEFDWNKFTSVAVGPGLNTTPESEAVMQKVLRNYTKPIVLDADAINLLSKGPDLLASIPPGSILTPHVKEFDRLFGQHANWWQRLQTGNHKAKELKSVIILKNRYTFIFTPEGQCLINPTGSPAMATGGTGDVLTGMIVSLLAQGYTPENAAKIGVFIHGMCGEIEGAQSIPAIAHRIIERIPETIRQLTVI